MGTKGASYYLFGAGGFILGALYKIWMDTGFDLDVLHSDPNIAGTAAFGAGGAVVAMIICWFL